MIEATIPIYTAALILYHKCGAMQPKIQMVSQSVHNTPKPDADTQKERNPKEGKLKKQEVEVL